MKNIVIKCLVLSVLAIGMSSIVTAGEYSKTGKLCDEATLIGRYHHHLMTQEGAASGHYVFYGNGNGLATSTFHWTDLSKPDPVAAAVHFTYSMDAEEDCKFNLQGFAGARALYVADSGDSASLIASISRNTGTPNTYEIIRGTISMRQRLYYRNHKN
jgi:hypothetical protein